MNAETFMLTGSMGCIGAWALRNLVREGTRVIATDLATDPVRPALLLTPDELAQITFVKLDVTDKSAIQSALAALPADWREIDVLINNAGLALGMVSVTRSRDQAQLVSTFLILLLAAVGGAMVPRFLMPPWLQTMGLFVPPTWAIDAYQALLWRDAEWTSLYPAWGVLVGTGLAGLVLAHVMARQVRR